MKKENIYEGLMIKMLEGNASLKEQEQFHDWLKEKPAHAQEYADFQQIWTATPAIDLIEKLDIEGDLAAIKAKVVSAKVMPTKVIRLSLIRRITAIVLPLVVMATALFFYFNQSDVKAPTVLADGTRVWLYQDAKLEYPSSFAADTRMVKLTGEAFFEVTKEVSKPFIIEAGAVNIRVLGTSFNVQSAATATNVIVNTGKVQLINKANPTNLVELTKGEKGTFTNGILEETINTDKNYRSWQTGVFEFDGTIPFAEVKQQLAKYYGPMELDFTENPECLLKANFEKEELSMVLEVIKDICSLQ